MAKIRLEHELKKLSINSPDFIVSAGPVNDNLFLWRARIHGPSKTPYEGGIFDIDIDYPTEYPFKPPKLRFVTKIFHPNIGVKGTVCVDILQDQWSPALTTTKILLSVLSLISSPNPHDPLNPEAAKLYLEDRKQYDIISKMWTNSHAM